MEPDETPLYRCANCDHPCCDHFAHEGACNWSDCDCTALERPEKKTETAA